MTNRIHMPAGDTAGNAWIDDLVSRQPPLERCRPELAGLADRIEQAFRADHKLLVCGNGGSAADALHIVGELMKRFKRPRPLPRTLAEKLRRDWGDTGAAMATRLEAALPAISLAGEISLATAFANDVGGELVFAQQVLGLGRPGDVLFCLSTSGRAANVLAACRLARSIGMGTVALTGQDGGELARISDLAVRAPADQTDRVQELHLAIYHALCAELERRFFA